MTSHAPYRESLFSCAHVHARRIVCALACLFLLPAAASAVNPIQVENAKAGTPTWELFNPATGREIEGYASLTSINRGGQISLYVNTSEPSYTIEVFRVGWYNGAGARRVMGSITRAGTPQVTPTPDPVTGMVECRWTDPYVLTIPNNPSDATDWASGVYLAKLTAGTSGKQSYIIFVVRDDARPSDYLFQSSVTTFQAYNNWGGKSLYNYRSAGGAAKKVSFNRPYSLPPDPNAVRGVGAGDFLDNQDAEGVSGYYGAGWEVNMVRFLEREGYDVTYCTNLDTHADPNLLLSHRGFLSVGHDEYWSWQMRANVEAARDRGVSLGFFSANTCYWQVRFEPSPATGAPDRTMVGYKATALSEDPLATDGNPSNDHLITTRWRDSPVNRPEDAMIGVMYEYEPGTLDVVIHDATHWVCANTGLRNGDRLPGLNGFEVDRLFGNAPPGTALIAHSPYTLNGATTYADMTAYTAASGATVFAAGSMQWSWGLDDYNAPAGHPSFLNAAAQQMTRNVLERFVGATPPPTPAPTPTPAPATAFNDNFDDNSRDASKWGVGVIASSVFDGTMPISEANQRLEIAAQANASGNHYSGYLSVNTYDFTGGTCEVELIRPLADNGGYITAAGVTVGTGDNARVTVYVSFDRLSIYREPGGGFQYAPYSPSNDRWVRIRHDAATDTFRAETSPDGLKWAEKLSVARASAPLKNVKADVHAGTQGPVAAPGTAVFDNFRLAGAGAPTPTPTPTPTPSPTPTPTPTPAPAAPSGLTAAAASAGRVDLSWSDNSANEDGFRVERCQGAGCTNYVQVAQVGANVTTFQNTGLSASTTYIYRVRAFNAGGHSGYSNTAQATTPAAAPPAAPTALVATSAGKGKIKLTWADNSGDEQLFSIERSTSPSGGFAEVATAGANVTTYQDAKLDAGQTYYYRVRASSSQGGSAYSNTASATAR